MCAAFCFHRLNSPEDFLMVRKQRDDEIRLRMVVPCRGYRLTKRFSSIESFTSKLSGERAGNPVTERNLLQLRADLSGSFPGNDLSCIFRDVSTQAL